MSYMKTVTLRAFKHHSRYQRMAHDGQPVLVTHRGRPYFRALPPEKTGTFLGAARGGKPLTAKALESVLSEGEWHSGQ
jgi:antitoxin (DNA-binding transcriptional repressor) of toxin-antitoxin stability system